MLCCCLFFPLFTSFVVNEIQWSRVFFLTFAVLAYGFDEHLVGYDDRPVLQFHIRNPGLSESGENSLRSTHGEK